MGVLPLKILEAIAEAGADTFVAGSAIYGSDDYRQAINCMRAELSKLEFEQS